MKATELIMLLQGIVDEKGDFPIHIPYNCGADDFKECTTVMRQQLYFGPMGVEEKECIVLRNFD